MGIEEEEQGSYAASLASIREAQKRIAPLVTVTPVLTSSSLNQLAHANLYFKCELFQKGGNHAAAVALAAKLRNIPAFIVMPNNAPKCKVANVKRYEGNIRFCDPTIESREKVACDLQEETGATMIHPFNDGRIISGQGTIALEPLEQVPELDAIIVPISGGGLISGISLAAKAIKSSIKIFAAEPKGADDAAQSKAAGKLVTLPHTDTIADGLKAWLGSLTWPVVCDMVDEVITVTDEEIVNAMRMCYKILKLVVEPIGAVGLAAVLSAQFQSRLSGQALQHVGIVLSGGNVDLDTLGELFKGDA